MKNKILTILVIISLFFVFSVNAQNCTTNEDCKSCSGTKSSPCGCTNGMCICATTLQCDKKCGAECETNTDCNTGYQCDSGLTGSCTCKKTADCTAGDTKKYTCPDGTQVDWCHCSDGSWICVNSPENACPTTGTCTMPGCKDGSNPYFTGKIENGCKVYACPQIACEEPVCKDGSNPYFTGRYNENGCKVYECPVIVCTSPLCKDGEPYFTGRYDENGCKVYACPGATCTMPGCKNNSEPVFVGQYDMNNCKIYRCPEEIGEKPQVVAAGGGGGGVSICPAGCICKEDTTTCPTIEGGAVETVVETTIEETETGTKTISIEKTEEGKFSIKAGEVTAVTAENFIVEESKLYMVTSAGNKQVKILPEEASKATEITTVKEIELKEEDAKPVYSIKGAKQVKILFIIPISMEIETKISAETGEIISVNKPWWSFIAQ